MTSERLKQQLKRPHKCYIITDWHSLTCSDLRLVANDTHSATIHAREADHNVASVVRHDFKELIVVHDLPKEESKLTMNALSPVSGMSSKNSLLSTICPKKKAH